MVRLELQVLQVLLAREDCRECLEYQDLRVIVDFLVLMVQKEKWGVLE